MTTSARPPLPPAPPTKGDLSDLALAEHFTALFGAIHRWAEGCEATVAARLLHRLGSPDARAELKAHVDAGWLEEHTRREGSAVVARYRVLRAGWLAIDGLLEASCA